MKVNNILFIFILLIITLISFSCVVANEDTNITDDSSILELNDESNIDLNENTLSANEEDSVLTTQTIIVDEIGSHHNEMNEHTIRNAINSANAGDTIIIKGDYYEHTHVTINKPLTIKSEVGTNLDPCTSRADSGFAGIFYLNSAASGTIIEGFNFNNDDGRLWDDGDYAIFINGASNVIIRNCTFSNNDVSNAIRIENSKNTVIENIVASNALNGLLINNSQEIIVKNSIFKNSKYGIYDMDSTKTTITLNNISNNKIAGIAVAGTSKNPIISFNNITNNKDGIALTSSDNIDILSNYIASNSNFGVFVNCEVTQLNIIGNFFYQNSNGETYFNKKVFVPGGEKLEVVNYNYMVGVGERPVDAAVGGGAFLGYTFILNENVYCPKIYFEYGEKHWEDGNYLLKLTEITQTKKGIYTISIVDPNGNVAKGLSSVPVTFYLNKNNNFVAPQEGDVYQTVMMVDGTATVRFYPQDFKESGNVITVVLPGTSAYLTGDQFKNVKNFTVKDTDIPGEISATKIIISDLTTYPNSNVAYTITLKDIYNNPIANEPITVNINSKTTKLTTNAKGQATIKINQKTGKYTVKVTYAGDDIEYAPTSSQAKIIVDKLSTKIVASNYAMFIKKADYYKLTLKDSNGKVIANQKIKIKVKKKTYNVKTNAKGVAKVKLKLKKGTYKVQMTYNGNNKFKAAKATKKITVKKVLKTKLTAPKVTIAPKTAKKYVVTLKDENGKAIKKQKVTIKVNGKKYTKKTNKNGQAIIKVKFSKQKTYKVKSNYKGSKKYKRSSASGKIIVKKASKVVPDVKPQVVKVKTQLTTYDRTFSLNSSETYVISLKDASGQSLANQAIKFTLNNQAYSKNTDGNGQVKVNVSSLSVGSYIINVNYPQTDKYEASSSSSTIHILNKTGVSYVDGGLANDDIQGILNRATDQVAFLSDSYNDISLTIDKPLNITFKDKTTLNGKINSPVLTISVSNFNISNLIIHANSGSGIVIQNAENISISDCNISNTLDSSKSSKYNSGEILIPGNGISLSNATNVKVTENSVKSFGNAIFAQNSDDLKIIDNTLSLSNYGINYGADVKNTNISNNLITKNIGLYVMDIPEGPLGYGIFLNQSAVNVSIINNRILDNYMGISVDANYSTGIVILRNWISDNALEGIRFNAGYDLAENAVEPNVNDNAIYRNAKGPSMMILGELSANPNGIYHYGEFNDTQRLQLGTNWYGKNARITWDYATNTTGYGTMCPRIATTYMSVKEIEVVSPGFYQIKFYKNDTVASNLPVFEMFATLNDNVEVKFNVINGVGIFSFDSGYNIDINQIKVSIGSLKDQYRTFEVLLNKTLDSTEIPTNP
jgi:parallel beta-helix repeat protein